MINFKIDADKEGGDILNKAKEIVKKRIATIIGAFLSTLLVTVSTAAYNKISELEVIQELLIDGYKNIDDVNGTICGEPYLDINKDGYIILRYKYKDNK